LSECTATVDATVAQSVLDLFRKEALALELVQRAIDLRNRRAS